MGKFFSDLGIGIKNVFKGPASKDNLFTLDNRAPFKNAAAFGLQHVLAMFASNITPIIIVFTALGLLGSEYAINSMLGALFMAGICTIAQLLVGARLPIVSGTSFTFVPIMIAIAKSNPGIDGYYTIMGAVLIGGLFAIVFSLLYRWWGKLIKPIVPPIVILGVGLSLLASGANSFFGGTTVISDIIQTGQTASGVPYFCYIIVALVTIISAILWSLLFKGVWKNINIFIGIAIGYIVSCCIPGMVDFSSMAIDPNNLVSSHGIFDFPHLIDVTKLRFEPLPCVLMAVCFIVTITESIGNSTAIAVSCLERKPTHREVNGAIVSDACCSTIGCLFGALPFTSYAQNVGIVAQTKVVNRFTIFTGAAFLVIASFFPPIANLIYSIPDAVIGGTMVILFGSIAVIGMKTISEIGWSDKNIMIVSICLCLGFGIAIANVTIDGVLHNSLEIFDKLGVSWLGDLLSNNILNMFVLALILSWALPENMYIPLFHRKEKEAK